ncbi:MAG TPA: SH3-like domain-containing protein [Myxococcota bacterium]
MTDVHDLGGRLGLGRIEREAREPVFHAPWEGRVCGLVNCAIGFGWIPIDVFRCGIERMDPERYLRASYYERWLTSLERVLAEAGVLARGYRPPPRTAPAGFERAASAPPRFRVGDAVRTTPRASGRHTRLPGYAGEKRGVVAHARRAFVFPDTNAHGVGEQPQHLYTVRFAARELWGERAEPRASVCVDLFEPYLEESTAEDGCDGA